MTRDVHSDVSDWALSTEDLHAILSSEDRRHVIRFFQDREERLATLDELVNFFVALDGGYDDPPQAKVVLHHSTLPKLADAGAIDYDYRTNVTRYHGDPRLEALVSKATV